VTEPSTCNLLFPYPLTSYVEGNLEGTGKRLTWVGFSGFQMTIAFASVMAVFIIERIDETTGRDSLIPLLIAGAGSVAYWRSVWSEWNAYIVSVKQPSLFFLPSFVFQELLLKVCRP